MPLLRPLTALALVLAALLVAQATASAEDGPRFKRIKVSIWPEYDAPSVLVMYQGDLADDVQTPATVRYTLPQGAKVHAAAEIDASGQYLEVTPQVVEGENPGASYTFNQRSTQFEFYFQPVDGAGRREIAYTVRVPGPTGLLQVEVQKPLRATNFVAPPGASATYSDKEGFQYQRYDYNDVAAGREIALQIAYDKPDAEPSVKPQQTQPGGVEAAANSQYVTALVAFGLAAVLLGVFFYLYSRRRPAPAVVPAGPRRKKNGGRRSAPGMVTAASAPSRAFAARAEVDRGQFCTQCGNRARAEAVFCTVCGRPLKRRA